jgi:hypothetical protein
MLSLEFRLFLAFFGRFDLGCEQCVIIGALVYRFTALVQGVLSVDIRWKEERGGRHEKKKARFAKLLETRQSQRTRPTKLRQRPKDKTRTRTKTKGPALRPEPRSREKNHRRRETPIPRPRQ